MDLSESTGKFGRLSESTLEAANVAGSFSAIRNSRPYDGRFRASVSLVAEYPMGVDSGVASAKATFYDRSSSSVLDGSV